MIYIQKWFNLIISFSMSMKIKFTDIKHTITCCQITCVYYAFVVKKNHTIIPYEGT